MFLFFKNDDEYEERIINTVETDDIPLLQKYVREGHNVSFDTFEESRPNLLFYAKSAKAVELLAHNGCYLNQRTFDKDKNTPLHYALIKGQTEAAIALIQAGANINAFNNNHVTPLMMALKRQNLKAANAVMDAKPDLNLTDLNQNTAFHYLSAWENKAESAELFDLRCRFIQAGADINACNSNGETPARIMQRFSKTVMPIDATDPIVILSPTQPKTVLKHLKTHVKE